MERKSSGRLVSASSFRLVLGLVLLPLLGASCSRKEQVSTENSLKVAMRARYRTLDPAHAGDYYSGIAVSRAYEPLLRYHYLKRPYELEANLAEAMPKVSADQKTYTFKIKKGVVFQNDAAFGTQNSRTLTAQDFVYSYKRLIDPREASEAKWIFDGKLLGLQEWSDAVKQDPNNFDKPLAGLVALDEHTLQIKLQQPCSYFLFFLAMPYSSVVSKEVVAFYGKDFGEHPVGTGPFQLFSKTSNQLVWKKNPNFRIEKFPSQGSTEDQKQGLLADAGKQIPFVDTLVDDIIPEDQPAWLNFMQGNHDYLMKIPKDNTLSVWGADKKPKKELQEKNISVLTTAAVDFTYDAFNMEDPVVGGPKNRFLRLAMSLAFDEAPSIDKFYLGLAEKANFAVPPGIFGFDRAYKNPNRAYNLVKAREILDKAGHANGQGIPELEYLVLNDTSHRQQAEYFKRCMEELGLKIRINATTWPEMLGRIRTKKTQIFGISWLFDYPDPENGLQLLYGKNVSPGPNEANYVNPEYDKLYEKFSSLVKSSERLKYLIRMRKIFEQDVPWIIELHRAETRLAQSWTKNLKIHAFDHNIEKYLRIDSTIKAKAIR